MSWQVREVARRAGIDHRPDPADAVRLADEGQPAAHRMRRVLADLDVDDHVGPFQRAHDLPEPGRFLVARTGGRARRPCRAAGRGAGRRARRRRRGGGRDRDRLRTARRWRANTRRRTRVAWPSWRNSLGTPPTHGGRRVNLSCGGRAKPAWRLAGSGGEAGRSDGGLRGLRRREAGRRAVAGRVGVQPRHGIHCPTSRAVMHYSRRHERHAPAADTGAHVRYTCPS